MDVDTPTPRPRSREILENGNAQAGPSSQTIPPPPPHIFFQPPPDRLPRRPLVNCTEDLITRFQLLPAYDRYVRPYVHVQSLSELHGKPVPAAAPTPGMHFGAPTPSALDKGKGREILVGTPQTPAVVGTPAPDGGEGGDMDDDEGGKGEKKKKNSYKHLIKDIPGKHNTKKDDYLQTMMLIPSKQKATITKFDQRTQREAFTVSLDGLKGWNSGNLITESPQAKEDRRRRKEAKKLAKAQLAAGVPPSSTLASLPSASTAGVTPNAITNAIPGSHTSIPLSASTPGVSNAGRIPPTPSSMSVGTPRPAPPTQRGSSRPPGPGPGSGGVGANILPGAGPSHSVRPGTPSLAGASGGATPRPRPATPSIPNGTNGAASVNAKRGIKREHEEDIPLAQVVASAQKRTVVTGSVGQQGNLKGALGVGPPRPMKKARTDTPNHNAMGIPTLKREVPQQQPTPQGV